MSKSQDNQNNRSGVRAMAMGIIATVLLMIFIVIALLLVPKPSLPTFEITDDQGTWTPEKRIAVFPKTIKPGDRGVYEFIIRNESDEMMRYGVKMKEYLDKAPVGAHPFMKYRIKFDDIYIYGRDILGNKVDGEIWQYQGFEYFGVTIESGSEHRMTLEWWWDFYGDDVNDTLLGSSTDGCKLSVWVYLAAEVVE